MAKRTVCMIVLASVCFACAGLNSGWAFGGDDSQRLTSQIDARYIALTNRQSKNVPVELDFPLDFGVIVVTLAGSGNFSATISRTGTTGELPYIFLKVLNGFGNPGWDMNTALTPSTLRVSSTISKDAELNIVNVLLVHGILLSGEEPPYSYTVNLRF